MGHLMPASRKHSLSVVLCTHNPRLEYLSEAIEALERQTLSRSAWELVIVDNASATAVADLIDVAWHPSGRVVCEQQLGLSNARLRGIAESTGEIVVFIDDDNILDSDYLENTLLVADRFPMLGAWGGQQRPRCETEPAAWVRELYFGSLAIRQFDKARWTNIPYQYEAAPYGAGMCVRRGVLERWAAEVARSHLRRGLGRTGAGLGACEDTDIACTSLDVGMGVGVFPELKLTHIMPAFRFEEPYLLKLAEGFAYSEVLLRYCRDGVVRDDRLTAPGRVLRALRRLRLSPHDRRKQSALQRGHRRAVSQIQAMRRAGT